MAEFPKVTLRTELTGLAYHRARARPPLRELFAADPVRGPRRGEGRVTRSLVPRLVRPWRVVDRHPRRGYGERR
jgi:hypothetical protein